VINPHGLTNDPMILLDAMDFQNRCIGFDHGVGHPLLLLDDAKAPNCQKNKIFKGLGYYSAWPKGDRLRP